MVSSAGGQYRPNPALLSVTLAGMMGLSCSLWIALNFSQEYVVLYTILSYNKIIFTRFARSRWMIISLNIFHLFMDLESIMHVTKVVG